MRNRSVGSHMMNEHSSRSHTILTVHITSEIQAESEKSVFISKQGKINFVGELQQLNEFLSGNLNRRIFSLLTYLSVSLLWRLSLHCLLLQKQQSPTLEAIKNYPTTNTKKPIKLKLIKLYVYRRIMFRDCDRSHSIFPMLFLVDFPPFCRSLINLAVKELFLHFKPYWCIV